MQDGWGRFHVRDFWNLGANNLLPKPLAPWIDCCCWYVFFFFFFFEEEDWFLFLRKNCKAYPGHSNTAMGAERRGKCTWREFRDRQLSLLKWH